MSGKTDPKADEKQADLQPAQAKAVYTYDDDRVAHVREKGRKSGLIRFTRGALVEDPAHVEALLAAGYKLTEGDTHKAPTAQRVSAKGK